MGDSIPDSALPDHEMARLLSLVMGRRVSALWQIVDLTEAEAVRFADLVRRRQAGEPLQYLEGTVQFGPLVIAVDERVLIPRPETEYLYELAAGSVGSPRVIVDLCTGSGALALSLKHRFPMARVIGSDLSADALEVAVANGLSCDIEVEWVHGDLFSALPAELKGTVDVVVANPPYVAEAEWPGLPVDVRHEPYEALVAGPAGTELIRRLLVSIPGWMAAGGEAWIEIGETQGAGLADEFEVEVVADQYGRDRFLRWRL